MDLFLFRFTRRVSAVCRWVSEAGTASVCANTTPAHSHFLQSLVSCDLLAPLLVQNGRVSRQPKAFQFNRLHPNFLCNTIAVGSSSQICSSAEKRGLKTESNVKSTWLNVTTTESRTKSREFQQMELWQLKLVDTKVQIVTWWSWFSYVKEMFARSFQDDGERCLIYAF